MAKKKIIVVGFSLNDEEMEFADFDSDISLLDWDIVLFRPDIGDFSSSRESYNGRPSLDESHSFRLKERSEHWRREIKDSVSSGKTVFVFLAELDKLYVDTGKREFSGTGRNRHTTIIVGDYSNYSCLPVKIDIVKTKGTEIKLAAKGGEAIASYWEEFGGISNYNVILTGENIPTCLFTKNGDKSVGAVYRSTESSGALVLLPDIDFYDDSLLDEDGEWTEESKRFSKRLLASIVAMDKVLKGTEEYTPEPSWASGDIYRLSKEKALSEKLLVLETRIEEVQREKESLLGLLQDAGRLRGLLYEKGKPLEVAILDALLVLGFEVQQYDDGKSEFDVVFESKEGRLIGEAEGKDNKAINVEKLRQLALNVYEDLEREEIKKPAKSVLFGNPYRLQSLEERVAPFTDKCVSAATTSSTALVFTPDLFEVAKYLSDKKDARFAVKCRKALLDTVGRVVFPAIQDATVNLQVSKAIAESG
jgi:hypothetical protein